MYILDTDRQISLIREMTQLRKDTQSWEVYYHHPSTNAMWKSYFPKATGNNRGPKVLRTEPVPNILEKRLENCLVEDVPENAIGLGIELSARPERWKQIMDIVAQNYHRYHRSQLPLFLKNLCIESYKPLFKEIDYKPEANNIPIESFDLLARRSKKIRLKRFWSF
jgi:hypothetical protein